MMLRLPSSLKVAIYQSCSVEAGQHTIRRLRSCVEQPHLAVKPSRAPSRRWLTTVPGKDESASQYAEEAFASESPNLPKEIKTTGPQHEELSTTAKATRQNGELKSATNEDADLELRELYSAFALRMQNLSRDERRTWKQSLKSWLKTATKTLNASEASGVRQAMTAKFKDPKPLPDANSLDMSRHFGSDTSAPDGTLTFVDLDYVKQHLPLPDQAQYADELFRYDIFEDPSRAVRECVQRNPELSMSADLHHRLSQLEQPQNHPNYPSGVFSICTLSIHIPDVCTEVVTGHGSTKKKAKAAAWLHALSNMHCNGSLRTLFPTTPDQATNAVASLASSENSHVQDEASEEDDIVLEPANLTYETVSKEAGVKIHVYDFTAGLGIIPNFEYSTVIPNLTRSQKIRQRGKKSPLVKATLRIPELGINISAIDQTARHADIAVSLAFKKHMEKLNVRDIDPKFAEAFGNPDKRWPLTFDNFLHFLNFCSSKESNFNLEMECETFKVNETDGEPQQQATLTINGKPAGHPIVMPKKYQAEKLAYLTAAVQIASENPSMMSQFIDVLQHGVQSFPASPPAPEMGLEVEYETLSLMRKGLLEAHRSNLTDVDVELDAEQTGDAIMRRVPTKHKTHELIATSEELSKRLEDFSSNPKFAEIRSKRALLPIRERSREVLEIIRRNPVCIIIGPTGSGKTLQVPQLIFEDAIAKRRGASCNIICTQPRRVAATSVAERVAHERGESIGEHIGYRVRFDSKMTHNHGGITYCTTGILLAQLQIHGDAYFDMVSHIVLDEVHERSRENDFLMIILRRMLKARRQIGRNSPKIVLMSATIDIETFTEYFSTDEDNAKIPCPYLSVKGRQFNVQEKFLGDIFDEMTEAHSRELGLFLREDRSQIQYLQAETAFSKSYLRESNTNPATTQVEATTEQSSPSDDDPVVRNSFVPIGLVAATIAHICSTSRDGAILAFLPGRDEILATTKILDRAGGLFGNNFDDQTKFSIHVLHSSIPKEDQQAVFNPVPENCRKIVLATNIAETSITIPEVKFVVDSGKLREEVYDQQRRISTLETNWESKANVKQRAGRAGRIQNGTYYGLFSKERYQALSAVGTPEMLRTDLQNTCLAAKASSFAKTGQDDGISSSTAGFLAEALDPPPEDAVESAIASLKALEVFTKDQRLTDLGRVLSELSLHPALGKMVIIGIVFRCLDPMIILGAAAEMEDLLVRPRHLRDEARAAHGKFLTETSDHFGILAVFNAMRNVTQSSGLTGFRKYATENFLNFRSLRAVENTARQIEDQLVRANLIPPSPSTGKELTAKLYGSAKLNQNSGNKDLIRGLLASGLYPNLAVKTLEKGPHFRIADNQHVLLHPHSANSWRRYKKLPANSQGKLVTYQSLKRSADGGTLFAVDSTVITPFLSTLFGGRLEMHGSEQLVKDGWIPFKVKNDRPEYASKIILEYRKVLDRLLAGAFRSLSQRRQGTTRTGYLADDPVREAFAKNIVEVLNRSSGRWYDEVWTAAAQERKEARGHELQELEVDPMTWRWWEEKSTHRESVSSNS